MEIFALAFVFILVSIGLVVFAKIQERRYTKYETRFIKGAVRGHMGRFNYRSVIEKKRDKLNRKNSKF